MVKLANDKGTTFTTDNLHCLTCAGLWIERTIQRPGPNRRRRAHR